MIEGGVSKNGNITWRNVQYEDSRIGARGRDVCVFNIREWLMKPENKHAFVECRLYDQITDEELAKFNHLGWLECKDKGFERELRSARNYPAYKLGIFD